MTTAFEHMQADMDWVYAQDGESVVDITLTVAGGAEQPLRSTVKYLETDPVQYEGASVERVELGLLAVPTPEPIPGREVKFNGVDYECESWLKGRLVSKLTLMRYIA